MKKLIKKWLGIAEYQKVNTELVEKINEQLNKVRQEVFGPDKEERKEKGGDGLYYNVMSYYISSLFTNPTLKERVETQRDDIQRANKMIELILKHFNLERVKITEENGTTEVIEKLRPRKKEKPAPKEKESCDCC